MQFSSRKWSQKEESTQSFLGGKGLQRIKGERDSGSHSSMDWFTETSTKTWEEGYIVHSY